MTAGDPGPVLDLSALPGPVRDVARWFAPGPAVNPVLAPVMEPFAGLAALMITGYPPGEEMAAGLRKLLEARECFIRVAVDAGAGLARATRLPPG